MSASISNFLFLKGIPGSLFLYLLGICFLPPAYAVNESVHLIDLELQEDLKRVAGDEALMKLEAYRKEVEATSYKTTLKLCEGYRRAANLGPHPYHGRYMFSFEEAMDAWGKVMKEGALQTFNGMLGQKADYIRLANLGFFDFRSWFDSVYSIYLIQSDGFLQGAMHCLDSVKASDINKLAAAIVIVDNEASLLSLIAGGEIAVAGAKTIFKALASVLSKSTWFVRSGRHLKNVVWKKAKRPLIYTTATGVGLGIGTLAYRKIVATYEYERQQEEIHNLLTTSPASDLHHLLQAFEKLREADQLEKHYDHLSREDKQAIYSEFLTYVNQHFNPLDVLRLKQNVIAYKAENPKVDASNAPIEIVLADVVFAQVAELESL